MRKRIFGRRFKRDTNERKALFRSLMQGMILHGKIKTTEAKAKAIQADLEKLVTIGKTKGEDAKRQLMSKLANERSADKILAEIAPKFETRAGGYTKIIRFGKRAKDGASLVVMTWTETILPSIIKTPKRNTSKKVVKTKVESAAKIDKKEKVSKKSRKAGSRPAGK
jgi:large subunit ribosomal protein L17